MSVRSAAALPIHGSPLDRLPRTVAVAGRPTAIRLERAFWEHLDAVCAREGLTIEALCTDVDRRRGAGALDSALQVFVVSYFRRAAPLDAEAPAGNTGAARLDGVLAGIG